MRHLFFFVQILPNNCRTARAVHLKFKLNAIDLCRFVYCIWQEINHKLSNESIYVRTKICRYTKRAERKKKKPTTLRRRYENDKHETSCFYTHFLKKTSKLTRWEEYMAPTNSQKMRWNTFECSRRILYFPLFIANVLWLARDFATHIYSAQKINTTEND